MDNIIECTVEEISEVMEYKRTSKPAIKKRLLTLTTEDGQMAFMEIRNLGLFMLDKEGINVGDKVTVNYVFQGNINKEDNRYNNLLITNIIKR